MYIKLYCNSIKCNYNESNPMTIIKLYQICYRFMMFCIFGVYYLHFFILRSAGRWRLPLVRPGGRIFTIKPRFLGFHPFLFSLSIQLPLKEVCLQYVQHVPYMKYIGHNQFFLPRCRGHLNFDLPKGIESEQPCKKYK